MKIWLSMVVIWLMSCINTSYSRLDEVEITGNELDLVLGQFAHHGDRFYENEVTRAMAILSEDRSDFVARNDLASAYIKLKRYEEAVAEFDLNEKLHPRRYETAANRGVLYKKMEEYKLAADCIAASLDIKKEGHMGLGDYYLRMIQWLAAVEKEEFYFKNFLGQEYTEIPSDALANPLVNKEHLLTLIKNDYSFPDVYLVLGDVYFQEGNYQLAIRCYHRARNLGHHLDLIIIEPRLNEVANALSAKKKSGQLVEKGFMATHGEQVREEIEAAKEWLGEYQELEATLIGEGKAVDFKSMKDEMAALKMSKPVVKEAMIYKGEIVDKKKSVMTSYLFVGGFFTKIVMGVFAAIFLLGFIWLIRVKKSKLIF